MLIAAHPDDEILGLGGQLCGLANLSIVHATDGAPRDPADGRRAGFSSRAAYARARALELARALAAAGAGTARRRALGFADQEAIEHLEELLEALQQELETAAAVITHPYEGGHPDHDACALAVQCACQRLQRSGASPWRLEFASYHERDGRPAAGVFWPDRHCPQRTVRLGRSALARKRAALGEFLTQRRVLGSLGFDIAVERLRLAPRYDFSRPPPPGKVLYDRFGWSMTGERWRQRARQALQGLL